MLLSLFFDFAASKYDARFLKISSSKYRKKFRNLWCSCWIAGKRTELYRRNNTLLPFSGWIWVGQAPCGRDAIRMLSVD